MAVNTFTQASTPGTHNQHLQAGCLQYCLVTRWQGAGFYGASSYPGMRVTWAADKQDFLHSKANEFFFKG